MSELIPARGRLLVRPVDAAERYAGAALIIPSEARARLTANQVEVIAVGAFAECDPERSKAERKCARHHESECCYPRTADCDTLHTNMALRRVHPHAIIAGSWLLIQPRSLLAGPNPERAEYFVHQDSVLGIFNDETTT